MESLKSAEPVRKLKSLVRDLELWLKKGERTITIGGLSARFKIETKSDVYRLNGKFEEEYAEEIIAALKKLGKDGFVVNVGAAQGFYAVFSGVAGNHTLAIEPDSMTCDALEVNVVLNGLTEKVDAVKGALGDKKGEETLFTDGVGSSAPSFIKGSNQMQEVVVPVLRMDEIVRQEPDVAIIDVEGYEGKVLRGMGALRPKEIFIEIHQNLLEKVGETPESVQKLLSDMGYKLKNQHRRKSELLCHYILKNVNEPIDPTGQDY